MHNTPRYTYVGRNIPNKLPKAKKYRIEITGDIIEWCMHHIDSNNFEVMLILLGLKSFYIT